MNHLVLSTVQATCKLYKLTSLPVKLWHSTGFIHSSGFHKIHVPTASVKTYSIQLPSFIYIKTLVCRRKQKGSSHKRADHGNVWTPSYSPVCSDHFQSPGYCTAHNGTTSVYSLSKINIRLAPSDNSSCCLCIVNIGQAFSTLQHKDTKEALRGKGRG